MKASVDKLRLDGDDLGEFEDSLNETFGVTFSNEEAAACRTAGDVHDLLLSKLAANAKGEACAASMAFWRLRAALMAMGHARAVLLPGAPLVSLTAGRPRRFLKGLEQETGYRMPSATPTLVGCIGWFSWLAVVVAIVAALDQRTWTAVATVVVMSALGAFLTAVDPGKFPAGCITLGDLARRVVGLNHARLMSQGAAARPEEIWLGVREQLSEFSGFPPDRIARHTAL